MEYKLKRKIDSYLLDWKKNPDRMPLIIKGARQIGKTSSIEHFAKTYKYFVIPKKSSTFAKKLACLL